MSKISKIVRHFYLANLRIRLALLILNIFPLLLSSQKRISGIANAKFTDTDGQVSRGITRGYVRWFPHPTVSQVVDTDLRNRALSTGQLRGCSLFHRSFWQIPSFSLLGAAVRSTWAKFLCRKLLGSSAAGVKVSQPEKPKLRRTEGTGTQARTQGTLPLFHLENILYSHLDTHTDNATALRLCLGRE